MTVILNGSRWSTYRQRVS